VTPANATSPGAPSAPVSTDPARVLAAASYEQTTSLSARQLRTLARTTPKAAHESQPCAEARAYTAVPTVGAVALARCEPGGLRIAGASNRGFGNHNAFRRGISTATIETVPSTTTPITAASTAIPARRVQRAMRVRATNAPARTRASSDAR
jgi:hypothetical protein